MGQGLSSPANSELVTHFDKKELQAFQDSFSKTLGSKQVLTKQDLLDIYSKYFPFGDPTAFVDLIFGLFKSSANASQTIGFPEYISAWSIASRGNLEERIKWSFKFHDADGDGQISIADLDAVITACTQLTRGLVTTKADSVSLINQVLEAFDATQSKVIEYSVFASAVRTDPQLLRGFLLFDGLL